MNVPRLQEAYATDTLFADVRSYEGYNSSQVLGGRKSGRKRIYGLRTKSQAHQALEDFIREVGPLVASIATIPRMKQAGCGLKL